MVGLVEAAVEAFVLILDILVDFVEVGSVVFVVFASVGIILAGEADGIWDGAIVGLCDRPPVKSKEPTRNSNPNKLISLCSPAIKRILKVA